MFNLLKKVFGSKQDRDIKSFEERVRQINEYQKNYEELSNDELRHKTTEFRQQIKDYLADIDLQLSELRNQAEEELDIHQKEQIFDQIDSKVKERDELIEEVLKEILPQAFAVVKETSRRFAGNTSLEVTATDADLDLSVSKSYITIEGNKARYSNSWLAAGGAVTWNMVHYDVQLIGGMALHEGKIAEMATGEGKTLVATLPAYLNGLTGEGVHIVTVNDYLARRDSEWVGPIFEFLQLKVDCIDKYKPHSPQRKKAYQCDIVYGTNNEFGFDYLRDNMVRSVDEKVQIKHHYAMVDEVDSVLIDDARTPLIISGPVDVDEESELYNVLKPKVEKLVNEQKRLASNFLNDAKKLISEGNTGYNEGEGGLSLFRAYRALPKSRPLIKYLSEDGIRNILQKTENYYLQEQSRHMKVADAPLLFTIDEKNKQVELTKEGEEFLSRGESDHNFFLIEDIGTLLHKIDSNTDLTKEQHTEAKAKLLNEYAVKSQRLHAVSQLLKAFTLFEIDEEYVVLDGEVKIVDEGTGRILEGRRYSDGLHQAIEAKENVKVGELTQTYATITLQNYFRMYHKLAGMTGTAETEAGEFWQIYKLDVVVIPTNKQIIRDDREDLVYKTAREKFNAVIEEIEKCRNQGRPVLVGTTSVDISEKLSRMLQLKNIPHNVLNAKQHQREAEIVAEAGQPGKVTIATNMAGRGTDIKINEEVKRAGGLAIIGTERHESRRVDRQLRGRSGRQGDPGSSQFFVSFEDNLMRLFNSDRITAIMDKLGHKEGEVLQHSMVTKSIERAQKKVEENNFAMRKRLLDYDDVMNIQREAIYKKRDHALEGERLTVDLEYMFNSTLQNLVQQAKSYNDYEIFINDSISILGFEPEIDSAYFRETSEKDLIKEYIKQYNEFYKKKEEVIKQTLLPVITDVHRNEGHRYQRIVIPFADESKEAIPIAAELEKAVKTKGASIMRDIERNIALARLDTDWKEHLRNMDELKDSVQAASFEQKDPLVIYKMEAYKLFEQLVLKMNQDITSYLSKGKLMIQVNQSEVREAQQQRADLSKTRTNRSEQEERVRRAAEQAGRESTTQVQTVRNTVPKVGRNDACPCGSGKKFKNCHGATMA
ncbi:MAG: preprotein translocase subunit SecA [Saprospiraceae bacterium]|nr:preprotein translocase subunit SecA [Saprospiraceae bacterium]HMW38265.1 preprotein translocase subunit SecA [Saprospiraceae bacterium]HMX88550.1 preprotein translocase subunit SecA [Saprospiraceae bacterium]HMZ40553.1 preprotein translocase subunit SecA [Saprospiraceae bacterium]HNA64104.1 preprotein translocase subunit SecA [Saprospiraceae bacterium]